MSNSKTDISRFPPPPGMEGTSLDVSRLPPPPGMEVKTSEDVPAEDLSQGRTILHHAPQAATFGLSDELKAAAESPVQAAKTTANLFGDFFTPEETADYRKTRDEERELLAKLQEENPWTAGLSQVAGGIATLPLGGAIGAGAKGLMGLKGAAGAVKAAAPVATALEQGIVRGLGEGAAYGLGQSESDSALGTLKDTAVGAGIGGAMGGATGVAGRALFGNADDIARGALAEDTIKTTGLVGELKDSRIGQVFRDIMRAKDQNIPYSSNEAIDNILNKSNITSADLAKATKGKLKGIGAAIGEAVEDKAQGRVFPEIESARKLTSQEAAEQISPIKYSKISNAPEQVAELDAVNSQIANITQEDPEKVINELLKTKTALIGPDSIAALEKELQYTNFSDELNSKIKEAVRNNPMETISDVVSTIVKKEAPSENYQTLLDSIQVRKQLDKLAKEAAVQGIPDPKLQQLEMLLDKRQALKKTIAMADATGKKLIVEPDVAIRKAKTFLDTSMVPEGEEIYSRRLKNILGEFTNLDGTLKEGSDQFRNRLFALANDAPDSQIGKQARELATTIKEFRAGATKGLSAKYHKVKVLQDVIGIDPESMSSEQIEQILGPKLSSIFEQINQPGSSSAGQLRLQLKALGEAFPDLQPLIKKGTEESSILSVARMKAGGENPTFGDVARRYGAILPAEIFADVATSNAGKLAKKTAQVANDLVLHGDSTALNYFAKKLEVNSPKASAMLKAAAETSDEGKKRAILNMLNQMPSFRQVLFNKGKNKEE